MADVARADQFRALRKAHRLTQPEMAEIAGVTLRAYQAWEREDEPGGIKFEHAREVGHHFGVDPETLVRRRDEDPLLLESTAMRETLERLERKLDAILRALNLDPDDIKEFAEAFDAGADDEAPEQPAEKPTAKGSRPRAA